MSKIQAAPSLGIRLFKKLPLIAFFFTAAYLTIGDSMFKGIVFGIAVFLIGMFFMEDGFKMFAGGTLQRILKKTTSNIYKAILSGFFATAIVQSSSLVVVIAISFLSANLMGLLGGVGIVFGSNLGTTATTWIVAALGVKIKIAVFAMPMVVFGVMFRFLKSDALKGFGNVLIGLGFIFLGIDYMKEGFEGIKDTIDLTEFSKEGILGILMYLAIGVGITVLVQSSSATMALAVTALATGQIMYYDALSLAIGANIGTTITAILASIASNSDGKRLALAHVIFNVVTAVLAIVLMPVLAQMVEISARALSFEDPAMKLALFHTFFNILGVLAVVPFSKPMVSYLSKRFTAGAMEPKYLNDDVVEVSEAALEAIRNETQRLYKLSKKEMMKVLNDIDVNIDTNYKDKIKQLYSNIVIFSIKAQKNMDEKQLAKLAEYKSASIDIIEAMKSLKHMQKNFRNYLRDDNFYVANEYSHIKQSLQKMFSIVKQIRKESDPTQKLVKLEMLQQEARKFDLTQNHAFEQLVHERKIDPLIATSIMNDSAYAKKFVTALAHMAQVLFIEQEELENTDADADAYIKQAAKKELKEKFDESPGTF
ncbi:MAG: Na/Pi cotransporter family protein [Campylobacterota bacterium]